MGRGLSGSFAHRIRELGRNELFREMDGAIYALPLKLIDELQSERHGKAFFSRAEATFEHQLSALVGIGAKSRQRIVYPLISGHQPDPSQQTVDKMQCRIQSAQERATKMLENEMASSRRTTKEIRNYFETNQEIETLVRHNQAGYSGWLVTNGQFNAELSELKSDLMKNGQEHLLPQVRKMFFNEVIRPVDTVDRNLAATLEMFCRRWALDSMVSWHLPLPMGPILGGSVYRIDALDPAGVALFLPWSLSRGFTFKTRDLQDIRRVVVSPNHLAEWMDGKPKRFGVSRFAMMLRLFFCLQLILRARYSVKIQGGLERFEAAFARFEGCSPESVRKVRLFMDRRLRAAAK